MKIKMNNTNVNAPLLGRGWGRLFLLLAFLGLSTINAQVGIGTTNPENTAALDVDSNEKGFLPPRMDTNQRDAINGGDIASGLVIYNNDVHCLQWYDGTD